MTYARQLRFTMLELVVVMVLLTISAAIVAPRLSGFFQGRRLDDEARRVWALSRFAREQAILQAVPMRLWIDNETGQYGIETMPGYGYALPPRTYDLAPHITVHAELVEQATAPENAITWWPDGSIAQQSATVIVLADSRYPTDAWRVTRIGALPIFTLERGAQP